VGSVVFVQHLSYKVGKPVRNGSSGTAMNEQKPFTELAAFFEDSWEDNDKVRRPSRSRAYKPLTLE
jgi:hypothetical protein